MHLQSGFLPSAPFISKSPMSKSVIYRGIIWGQMAAVRYTMIIVFAFLMG